MSQQQESDAARRASKVPPKRPATDGGRLTDAEDEEGDRRANRMKQPSRLSMRLKQASSVYGSQSVRSMPIDRNDRRGTVAGPPSNRMPPRLQAGPDGLPMDGSSMPYLDAERRALRGWLRDTLSIRTVGHHRETAAFLLLGGVRLKEPDMRDVSARQRVDEMRRNGRVSVAQGAADRAKVAHTVWSSVLRECIEGGAYCRSSLCASRC